MLSALGGSVVLMGAIVVLLTRYYRRVPASRVLVRQGPQGITVVARQACMVYPIIHHAEELDVSTRAVSIDRRAGKGLVCSDADRLELKATFFVRVGSSTEQVLEAAREVGAATINDEGRLRAYLEPKLQSALEAVVRTVRATEVEQDREKLRDVLQAAIELGSGLVVEDIALEEVHVAAELAPYR